VYIKIIGRMVGKVHNTEVVMKRFLFLLIGIMMVGGVAVAEATSSIAGDAVVVEAGLLQTPLAVADTVESVDFADVAGVSLSVVEMNEVNGGQHADMDGSYGGYGPYDRLVERNMSTRSTKAQLKESAHMAVEIAAGLPRSIVDVVIEVTRISLHSWIDRL